jgi:uncharacterized protein YegL
MKKNKVNITLLLDRSGSMAKIQNESIDMVKNYIKEQKKIKDKEIYLSIYHFDDKFEKHVENLNIQEYNEDKYVLIPRGWTALYDAIGITINSIGEKLSLLAEEERPEKNFVIVLTDGEENQSKEFSASKIKEMIKHQEDKYNWSFIFLGANIDSYKEGSKLGYSYGNTINWTASKRGVKKIGETLCSYTNRAMTCNSYKTEFLDEERIENASL